MFPYSCLSVVGHPSSRLRSALPLLFAVVAACAEAGDGGDLNDAAPSTQSAMDSNSDAAPPWTVPLSYPEAGAPDGRLASDAGTVAIDAEAESADLCHLQGDQVGMMGDSYLDLSGDITRFLQDTARKAGALQASESYLDHSLFGASMDGFPNVPSQWPDILADAKSKGSKGVKLLIMTGGGNDVLLGNRTCLDFPTAADISEPCKKLLQTILSVGQKVVDQAAKDGAKAIIYFFYPHLPEHLVNGPHPNTILDYAYPEVQKLCEKQTAIPCYFIDTRPAFDNGKGRPRDGLISPFDGIHPTPAGSKIIADLIWGVMQEKCLAAK